MLNVRCYDLRSGIACQQELLQVLGQASGEPAEYLYPQNLILKSFLLLPASHCIFPLYAALFQGIHYENAFPILPLLTPQIPQISTQNTLPHSPRFRTPRLPLVLDLAGWHLEQLNQQLQPGEILPLRKDRRTPISPIRGSELRALQYPPTE